MTMLDRMRRHKAWLKWSLALAGFALLVLGFPLIQPPPETPGALTNVLAQVGDQEITIGEFQTLYRRQLQSYQVQSGGEITSDLLRSMGIDRQLLQQVIDEYAALQEAARLGVTVSDAEVREAIVSLPAFQQDGAFIGEAAYLQMLRMQQPPMAPAEFEENVRRSLMLQRLQAAVTDWITVSDEDVEREHVRRNERVRLSAISFRADDYREGLEATDDDVAALFEQSANDYLVPEKRQLRFVLIDVPALKASFTPSDAEVQAYYDNNLDRYTEEVGLRVSHILLRTQDQDIADVQARASRSWRKRGAAPTSGSWRGGTPRTRARGRPRRSRTNRPRADGARVRRGGVRPRSGRGQRSGHQHVRRPRHQGDREDRRHEPDPGRGAGQHRRSAAAGERRRAGQRPCPGDGGGGRGGWPTSKPRRRGAASRRRRAGSPRWASRFSGLGFSTDVTTQAFQLAEGQVAGPIPTPTGPAFVTVTGIQAPYVPPLEEVEARVYGTT